MLPGACAAPLRALLARPAHPNTAAHLHPRWARPTDNPKGGSLRLRFCYTQKDVATCGYYANRPFYDVAKCCAQFGGCTPCADVRAAAKLDPSASAAAVAACVAPPPKPAAPAAKPSPKPAQPGGGPQFKAAEGSDVKGHDIPCGGQPFCRVCGGESAVRARCAATKGCAAFTYGAQEKCGYLKSSAAGVTARGGWVTYTRA